MLLRKSLIIVLSFSNISPLSEHSWMYLKTISSINFRHFYFAANCSLPADSGLDYFSCFPSLGTGKLFPYFLSFFNTSAFCLGGSTFDFAKLDFCFSFDLEGLTSTELLLIEMEEALSAISS